MPRSAPGADAFHALAEPRRRQIVERLSREGEQPVAALVEALEVAQPSVSKHLAVLRQAGIVAVSRRGRERLYRLEPEGLRQICEWTRMFERYWTHQIDRIASRAEAIVGRPDRGK